MDIQQNDIFKLEVDITAKSYMLETARWAKFLAILGFIFMGLGLIFVIFMGSFMTSLGGLYGAMSSSILIVYMLLFIGLYFYPVYALLKFSSLVKPALQTANQQQFNEALKYLKNMYKYIGILMIVILALYGVGIIFGIIGAAMR
jgi:hypothetical protein